MAKSISTRALAALPDVDGLRRLLKSLAMLDAVLSPSWESRYYSFNAKWSHGEQLGSMRNGQGDGFFAQFEAAGVFLKGFVHGCPMSPYNLKPAQVWPGVLDTVPPEFAACLDEPAFSIEDTSFCIWRRYRDVVWQAGPVAFPAGADPDGSEQLLTPLDGDPDTYSAWASCYYGCPVELTVVQHIYAHSRLTESVVRQLNPKTSLEGLASDLEEIGYPERGLAESNAVANHWGI